MNSVLLFTNTIAPYRLPVFEDLAQTVDLHVLFAQGRTSDRQWDIPLEDYTFQHTVLHHRTLRLGGATQLVNPRLTRHLLNHKPEGIILGDNRRMVLNGLLIGAIARILRSPLIVWTGITPGETEVAHSSRGHQWLFSIYRHQLFHRAAAIIAYGTATRRHLIDLGIAEDKIFSGTQVIPAEQLPPPAVDKNILGLGDKNLVLSVNYLVPRKGLDTLIRAFQRVAGDKDVLALVGSGPEEEHLRRIAGGSDQILFPGYQSGANKTSWYAAGDIFVFPTLHDPWGLVVNEAMAFGLPIITTDAAGCALDLVQDNGLVIPAGDAEALADALIKLLEDKNLRDDMGKRSREIIAGYTVDRASKTFVEALRYAQEH